jgi:hypothetical protein
MAFLILGFIGEWLFIIIPDNPKLFHKICGYISCLFSAIGIIDGLI